jgi:hypothetical protein
VYNNTKLAKQQKENEENNPTKEGNNPLFLKRRRFFALLPCSQHITTLHNNININNQ